MTINIDPNIFTIGFLTFSWHGLFSAIGVVAGVALAGRLLKGAPITEDQYYSVALWAVLGGFVGARLLFVLENTQLFIYSPLSVFAINEGGISVFGAVIGGTIATYLAVKRRRLSIPICADAAGAAFILGQGIGRIGDVINGEHHGAPTDAPWGVIYTHPNTLGELGQKVHLAVGYEMIYDFIAAGLLIWMRGRLPRPGMVYLVYIFLYSMGRLVTGFFRKDTDVLLGLGMAQLLSVGGIIISAAWIAAMLMSRPKETAPPARGTRRRRR